MGREQKEECGHGCAHVFLCTSMSALFVLLAPHSLHWSLSGVVGRVNLDAIGFGAVLLGHAQGARGTTTGEVHVHRWVLPHARPPVSALVLSLPVRQYILRCSGSAPSCRDTPKVSATRPRERCTSMSGLFPMLLSTPSSLCG